MMISQAHFYIEHTRFDTRRDRAVTKARLVRRAKDAGKLAFEEIQRLQEELRVLKEAHGELLALAAEVESL